MLKKTPFFSRFRKNKKIKKNTIKKETHKTSEFLDMEKSTKRKSFRLMREGKIAKAMTLLFESSYPNHFLKSHESIRKSLTSLFAQKLIRRTPRGVRD